jgi:hypothetical protein
MKKYKSIGFQVDIARQMETPETLRKIIDVGASFGYNELFLYGEGSLEYKSHPECSSKCCLKQDEFIALRDYAETKHSMRLIPIIPVFGHANFILNAPELKYLRELKNDDNAVFKCNMRQFCTSNPGSFDVIEDILKEWAEITSSPYIHVGGDESWNFATCPVCRETAEKIGRGKMLAEYFNRINAIVRKHGKTSMIWHDMLFYYENCLPHLDKDIVICDWHYEPVERHPGISIYNWERTDFFGAYGKEKLAVYICPKSKFAYTEESDNIRTLIEYSANRGAVGFLNTVWEMSYMPYASCYPSLAYGGACCNEPVLPESREFLHSFADEHFFAGAEILPLLVDLYGEIAEKRVFTGLNNWITYQDPGPLFTMAGKLDEAVCLCSQLKPRTAVGAAYLETLELIFKRLALSKRVEGLTSTIANALIGAEFDRKRLETLIDKTSALLEKIPAQIKLEKQIWDKYRPQSQPNPVVVHFSGIVEEVSKFISAVPKIITGNICPESLLPCLFEIALVNNDCSWQYLTIFSSPDEKNYNKVGSYPQCGPFGRYLKTFNIPKQTKFIRIELSGLGQLLLHYARLIGPGMQTAPRRISRTTGAVTDPENILTDDFRPTIIGRTNSRDYFSQGKEQPVSIIEIEF